MSGHRVLDRVECIRLLSVEGVGRLVLAAHGRLVARPVRFVIDGNSLVLATSTADEYEAGRGGDLAMLHADPLDSGRSGWTVSVIGRLSVVAHSDAGRLAAALRPLPRGEFQLLRLRFGTVVGRRLGGSVLDSDQPTWSDKAVIEPGAPIAPDNEDVFVVSVDLVFGADKPSRRAELEVRRKMVKVPGSKVDDAVAKVRSDDDESLAEFLAANAAGEVFDETWSVTAFGWRTKDVGGIDLAASWIDRARSSIHELVIGRPVDGVMAEAGLPAEVGELVASAITFPGQDLMGKASRTLRIVGIVVGLAAGYPPLAIACVKSQVRSQLKDAFVGLVRDIVAEPRDDRRTTMDRATTTDRTATESVTEVGRHLPGDRPGIKATAADAVNAAKVNGRLLWLNGLPDPVQRSESSNASVPRHTDPSSRKRSDVPVVRPGSRTRRGRPGGP